MTVSTTDFKVFSVGDGVTVLYSFTFHTVDADGIKAYVDGVNDAAITVALNADQGLQGRSARQPRVS